jgi:hypothetical protein
VKNLPHSCSAKHIDFFFKNLKGFKIARDATVSQRPVVFAEFSDVSSSKEAIVSMQGKVLFHNSNHGLDIEFSRSGTRDKESDAKIADAIDIRSGISSAETGRKMEEEHKNLDTVSKKPRHDISDSGTRDKESDATIADAIDTRRGISSAETGRKMEQEQKNLDTVSKKPRHDISDKSLSSMKPDERAAVRRVVIRDDWALASSSFSTHRSSAENNAHGSEPSSSGRQESKDAAFPYRNPYGEKVRVLCRFGQNCRSGSSCRFGHEVIAQTQRSAKNLDLRDSIHSNTR